MTSEWKRETLAIQAGWNPSNGEPRVTPIVQSTTYAYDTAADVAALFDLEKEGHMYSRISNPTVDVFEKKMAALEGGVGALATSGGQSASLVSILNICSAGDHFVATGALYGGTQALFSNTIPKMGIEVTFVDQEASNEEIASAFKENTRCFFAETLTNPSTDVLDISRMADIAHAAGVPLIVDNTFPTPYFCNPIEFGADIITHSTTKYIDGHATSVGGIIVDSGKFDWTNGKFPDFTEPDSAYHGKIYSKDFGAAAYIVKARVQLIRDMANYLSPMNAFLSNHGLETLHVRMDRHAENAQKVAEFLDEHPKVSWVKYPGLKSDPNYERAQKYLRGCSGVLTFGVHGGAKAGELVMNALKLARIVVHVGDVRTCVLHPASMTHRQLSEEELIKAGVSADLIRLSVGIENGDDIIADLKQALETVA